MHRLFWKLFLTFWLALILFGAGTLFSAAHYIEHLRALHDDAHNKMGFKDRAEAARAFAARDGLLGLATWAENIDNEDIVPILVLDQDGHDLLNREVPAMAVNHLHRHQAVMRAHQFDMQGYHGVTLPDGHEYWLVSDPLGVSLMRCLAKPKIVVVPIILATLASGLVGLLLARYLVVPMLRLRRATQAYAAGDLSHRVAPSFGRRRDELVDLAVAMDDMAEHLNSLLESKRSLLRDISHELRSPLARVQAALGLARQHAGSTEPELALIQRETERLNDLIGSILTFSRLDSGLRPILHQPLELTSLLAEAVESSRVEADLHQIRIDFNPEGKGSFLGDPILLYSAFENVLRNAVHHAPEASSIEVRYTEMNGSEHLIQVRDRGPGVPQTMLQTIFQPFVRVDQGRGDGIGLGLAISQRIIQSYKGRITAENHQEGGLLVSITLPFPKTDGDRAS